MRAMRVKPPASPKPPLLPPRFRLGLLVTILACVALLIPSIVSPYSPPPSMHALSEPTLHIPCTPEHRTHAPLLPPPLETHGVHPALHTRLFADYARFHATQRHCLDRYGLYSPRCAPVLLWTCPEYHCAGTGDRLRGIQFAYMLAAATRRVLLIDWSDPAALSAVMRPAVLDWTLPRELHVLRRKGKYLRYLDVPRLPWWACIGSRSCYMNGHVANISELPARQVQPVFKPPDVAPESLDILASDFRHLHKDTRLLAVETRLFPKLAYFLINPHFRRELLGLHAHKYEDVAVATSPNTLLRTIAHVLFRPSEDLAAELARRLAPLGNVYDAVHARMGSDFGEQTDGRFVELNRDMRGAAEALLDCMASIRAQHNATARRSIYLATDAFAFKDIFRRAAAKRGLRVETGQRAALHLSQSKKPREGSDAEERLLCDGFHDVFADMFALGGARVLVGTRSGFADLATRVGRTDVYAELVFAAGRPRVCEARKESVGLALDEAGMRRVGKRR